MTWHLSKPCWAAHPDNPGLTCQRVRGHHGHHTCMNPSIGSPAISWPNQKGTPQ